ncbi:MAG TPA: hypothetical protein VF829_03645 [Candidatus Paceibacterota bacterium]
MLPAQGLIVAELNGVDAVIKQTAAGQVRLVMVFDTCVPPVESDSSRFARLYRKLDGLVGEEKLRGPLGDTAPLAVRRFSYLYAGTVVALLLLLRERGVLIRIAQILGADDGALAHMKRELSCWIDHETTFCRNSRRAPKTLAMRKGSKEFALLLVLAVVCIGLWCLW